MSIAYQSDQGIATLTFDRPAKKNAITAEMYEQFVAALEEAAADDPVRAVLVAGTGGTFTAGNDLKDFSNPKFAQADSPVDQFMQGLAAFEKPVVAAVPGPRRRHRRDDAAALRPRVRRGRRRRSRCRSRASGWCRSSRRPCCCRRSRAARAPPRNCCSASRFPRPRRSLWASRTPCCRRPRSSPTRIKLRACSSRCLRVPCATRKAPAPASGCRGQGRDPARGIVLRAAPGRRRGPRGDLRDPREAGAGLLEVQVGR